MQISTTRSALSFKKLLYTIKILSPCFLAIVKYKSSVNTMHYICRSINTADTQRPGKG